MARTIILLSAILVAGLVTGDEEWSWGTANGEKGSQRSGRMNSDRVVFQESGVKGRTPRVDLGSRFDSHEPPSREIVNTVYKRPSQSHSVHTIDTPHHRPRVFSSTSTSSRKGSGVDVFVSDSPDVVNVPISVNVEKSNRKLDKTVPGNSEGRFLGKLGCKMGIGWDCGKGVRAQYVNLESIPYLPQPIHPHPHPQPIYPPQYPPQQAPPLNYGIKHSDVFHVQPVALQPVGTPIQAIPLGPSGGKVPHGPGLPQVHNYGGAVAHQQQSLNTFKQQVQTIPYSTPDHIGLPQLQPSYNPPIRETVNIIRDPSLKYDKKGDTVQHIHQHTHIYHGGKPSGDRYGGSSHRPSRDYKLPSIPPHPNSLHYTTGYGEACECVPSHRCSSYDVIGRDSNGFGLLDARSKKQEGDIIYSNNTAIEEEDSTDKPRTKRDTKNVKRQTNSFMKAEERRFSVGYTPGRNGCHRGDVCCRNPGRSDPNGIDTFTCGRRHGTGIVGRVKTPYHEPGDTEFGEYPWQAAILRRDGNEMVYVCGASLIDDRYVITAAHCVKKLKAFNVQVRLGEWDVANDDEFYPNVDFSVDNIITHRSYYAGMLHNDIALLKLDRFVDFGRYPHISPVCLPEPYSHFEGKICHVTGWGKDAFGKVGSFQKILKKVEVPFVRKSTCEHALQNTRLGRGFRLHDGMSCAGGEEGKDACKGDGGGPLVCRSNGGEYQLAGIVSWGIGCGERNIPGVYVDVPHYVDWIRENTRF